MTKPNSKFTKVLKFGGSSVGDANRIKNVCKIISAAAKKDRVAVVVSAMQGVTDKLLALDLNWIKEQHLATAKELRVPTPNNLLNELDHVIKKIRSIGKISPASLDLVASFGERLSSYLVAACLGKCHVSGIRCRAVAVDSREVMKTDNNFQNAAVDFLKTNAKIRNYFNKLPKHALPIITGFISSTNSGKTTTLGRGGSDYSAAIFGAALGVKVVEIWTDADGVMTADPRIVPAAFTLPQISYEDAFEMAYFGAKVVHPATMLPAIKKNLPILIKNTFNPKHSGTIIAASKKRQANEALAVKNISSLDNISLITIGGTELAGVPGTAERVFSAVAKKKVNVILIAQASSEHTICLAVNKSEAEKAVQALKKAFDFEIRQGKVSLEKKDDQTIIAVVGDGMRGVPGIAGRIFSALGRSGINVSAIAQGGSERNVSCVVDSSNKPKSVQALHHEFFGGSEETKVFLVGTGIVGGELLRQMNHSYVLKNVRMKICGIGDVDKMFFDNNGIDLKNWKRLLVQSPDKMDLNKFLEKGKAMPGSQKIFIDCTASQAIAKKYPEIVRTGFDIVTPNKKANVLPMKHYRKLREVLKEHNKAFHYQANVGAGLPVLASIKELSAAGDRIKKIEGIFSGTLSYLFNNFDPKKQFSDLVKDAKAKGYTEPDPREDLSGQDVGRKLLILARELSWEAELNDVLLENLADYNDEVMAKKFKKAQERGKVLRYVGALANGKISAKLKEVDASDPLANVTGTDNVVAIYSDYYKKNPLVIKGPGAGAEVTAATVLAGIIKTVKNLWKK